MKNEDLEEIQKKIKYKFKNPSLLIQALTHKSANQIHNERLEFLGDSILNYIISKNLYQKFPNINEGNMSIIRSYLVQKNTLLNLSKYFKLKKYLIIGDSEFKNDAFQIKSILINSLEAIIAGLFLDSSIKNTEKIVLNWYKKYIKNINPEKIYKDPKTKLQEYLQKNRLSILKYKTIRIFSKIKYQKITVRCSTIFSNKKVVGEGSNRKEAEQKVAKKILNLINNQKNV